MSVIIKQNKIYVGSLSSCTTETELRESFLEFGSIDDIKMIIDSYTGESKGFAFITFSSNASAVKALNMDGKELKERTIRVSAARNKRIFELTKPMVKSNAVLLLAVDAQAKTGSNEIVRQNIRVKL